MPEQLLAVSFTCMASLLLNYLTGIVLACLQPGHYLQVGFPHCPAVHRVGLERPSHGHEEGVNDSLSLNWNHIEPQWRLMWFFLLGSLDSFLKVLWVRGGNWVPCPWYISRIPLFSSFHKGSLLRFWGQRGLSYRDNPFLMLFPSFISSISFPLTPFLVFLTHPHFFWGPLLLITKFLVSQSFLVNCRFCSLRHYWLSVLNFIFFIFLWMSTLVNIANTVFMDSMALSYTTMWSHTGWW